MAEEKRFCSYCGAPLAPGEKICIYCGSQQTEANPAVRGQTAKKKRPLLWALIALVGVLAAAAVYLLFIKDPVDKGGEERDYPLFRVTYYKSVSYDGSVSEEKYTYNDKDHSGRIEYYFNGEQDGYALLTLNKKGQITNKQFFDRDGEKTKAEEHEYNDHGDQTRVVTYYEDGSRYEFMAKYKANHLEEWSQESYYDSNGELEWRDELEWVDKTHVCIKEYDGDGDLDYTVNIELRFEGNRLVEGKWFGEDGDLLFTYTWERDKYNNWTSRSRVRPDGRVDTAEQEFERIR